MTQLQRRRIQGDVMGQDIGRWFAIAARICISTLLIFSCPSTAAVPASKAIPREPRFIHFGSEHGLSSTINDLATDRQGYVWVATGDGLARYDGTKFRYWRRIVGVPASLPDNEVTLVHVDTYDRLWAATWFALSVLEPDQRIPRTIKFNGDAVSCGIDITAMTSTPEGVIWIGNHAGDLCRIWPDGTIARLPSVQGGRSILGSSIPVAMKVLNSGSLLIGADTGLWQVEPNNQRARPVAVQRGRTGGDAVFMLSSEADGKIWVGAETGLFLMNSEGKVLASPWALPEMSRRAVVLHDREGEYWIGSYNGLYSRGTGYGSIANDENGFGLTSGVSRILEDEEGGLWFASYSQGLLHLPPGKGRFWLLPRTMKNATSMFLSADIDEVGITWILSNNELHKIDRHGMSFRLVLQAVAGSFDVPRAFSVCSDGSVWIASDDTMVRFAARQGSAPKIVPYAPTDSDRRVEALSCARDRRLWLSRMGGGISLYSEEGKLLKKFSPDETLGEDSEAFIDLHFSPDGSPWYSDGKDLRRWDGRRFVRVPLPHGEYVYSFDFAHSTELWIARFGSIECYNWDGVKLHFRERVTVQEGLPSLEVRSVLVTSTGMIWLNTVRGLVQYDTHQRRARLYGLRDGLPGLDFTLDVIKRRSDGPAIAISREGVVMFDPDRSLPVPKTSALAIEAIKLRRGEDTIQFSRLGVGDLRAVMQPGDRDLHVSVRVMSFADPSVYRYRFKLGGYDPDWVDQGDRGDRVFSSLSPGSYILEIQGANADGVWSATRRIDILVEAPWWRRWWALVGYVIAISMLLWWIAYLYRLQLKRRHDFQLIAQKREVAEQASQAKSRFLANLGHEVRTPMTGVLGMSELLLSTSLDTNQQGQVRSIRRAGEHLLRLVNDALDLARIEAGRLELEVVDFDLDMLVEEVVALMRPLADRKGLTLCVDMMRDASGGWCGDPTRIRQILLNLLGNAVKFTERGEVNLSIETAVPEGLSLRVSDTGSGLDVEQQQRLFRRFEQAEGARTASRYGGSGLGLAICQELALAMDGGIELHSVPGEGTSFTVRLPLKRAARTSVHVQLRGPDNDLIARDVLLVEDDAIVADVLVGMLQAQGHRVTHAGHALAAMAEIATGNFDIALLDLDLPGMDGLALAQHLRAQGLTMPMIAITARADSGAESEAKAAGFDAFLRKPLTGDALGHALHDRLAGRVVMTE